LFPAEEAKTGEAAPDFSGAPIMEGDGITITGTRETTQQIRTLTKEEIEKANAPDLPTLLEQTLDLGNVRQGPYGNKSDLNIRGFDSERIALLVDGVPINSPLDGDFDLTMIDVDSIERIEVIYGGSDSKYNVSGALGGVINIITVKKQDPGFRMGGSISNTSNLPGKYYNRANKLDGPEWQDLLDTQKITVFTGLGMEKFSWSANLFANRAANHFLYNENTGTVRRRDSNEILDTGLSSSFIWNLADYTKLILGGSVYYGNKNFPDAPTSPVFETQKDFLTRQNILLDMPRIFRDDLAMEVSLSHSLQTLDYDVSHHRVNTLNAINRWSWYSHEKLTFRLGGDYRYSYLDSTDTGLHSGHNGGVYVTLEWQAHKKFLIIPSVKTVFNGKGEAVPIPKFGLLWQPNDSFSLKNNYFRSFKFPDFEDLYWHQPHLYYVNPDLKNEDGWGADLTAAVRLKNSFTLDSTVYAEWTNESIPWASTSGTWRPENVGEAVFFGWDTRTRFEIPLSLGPVKKIIPSFTYRYLQSYLLSYGYTWDSDQRIPYMPVHTIGASLEIPWDIASGPGSLVVSGHYESLRYADTSNLMELDPYFSFTVNINQRLTKNLAAFLIVRNAFNASYQSFYGYPMPGITVTLGIKTAFEWTPQEDNHEE
jgi:vitamin B12 transporter